MRNLLFIILIAAVGLPAFAQDDGSFQIARLKYDGGSDWYNGQTEEPNLLDFVKAHTNIKVKDDYTFVDINSDAIFSYPFLFMTGHGTVLFTDEQAARLRKYCEAGGFLYVDDDYGTG